MGNSESVEPTLKIVVIGGTEELLGEIFPISAENTTYQKLSEKLGIPYKFKKYFYGKKRVNDYMSWEAFMVPELTDENCEKGLNLIHDMLDLEQEEKEEKNVKDVKLENKGYKFDRKYVVIKFGLDNCFEYLLNMMNELSRVYMPQIAVVTDEELSTFNEGFTLDDNRFLTVIEENKKNEKDTIANIVSYLWERDAYYNERGNELSLYSPVNMVKVSEKSNNYVNILVTGISRAGKSTLINLIARKMISLESAEAISVTTKIKEYVIKRENEKVGIKFFDTPGLKKYIDKQGKEVDSTKMVIDLIDNKFKECDNSIEDIHLIYFVFENNVNLEDHVEFFKFLKKTNEKRIEKKRRKIPIIFIGNHNVGKDGFDALRKLLKDNKLSELYENIGSKETKKSNSEESYFNKFCKKKNNQQKRTPSNIIEVNLIKSEHQRVHGIDNILNVSLYFLKEGNPFKDFEILEEKINIFKKYSKKIEKQEKLGEEEIDFKKNNEDIKNLIIDLCEQNFLMHQIKNSNDIITKATKSAEKCIYFSLVGAIGCGFIPIPLLDLAALYPYYVGMVIKIGNCFSVPFSEIPTMDIAKIILGMNVEIKKSYTFSEDDLTVVGPTKVVANAVAYGAGNLIGANTAKKVGEQNVKKWMAEGIYYVGKGKGQNIIGKGIEEMGMKQVSKFNQIIEFIKHAIPGLRKGYEKGTKEMANKLGQKVTDIIIDNTGKKLGEEAAKEATDYGLKRGAQYAVKVAEEASSKKILQNSSSSFAKTIPFIGTIIGSLIGGVMNAYEAYNIGKNAIKYFEEYMKKTSGGEYLMSLKDDYCNIFKNIDSMAKEDYNVFDVDFIKSNEISSSYSQIPTPQKN